MNDTLIFEFPSPYGDGNGIDLNFSVGSEKDSLSLSMVETKGNDAAAAYYNYSPGNGSLYEIFGHTSLMFFEYSDFPSDNSVATVESDRDNFKNNLVIKKIEFDEDDDKLITARVEFKAKSIEDARDIKASAKAHGFKVK